jgi:hypothetical protein
MGSFTKENQGSRPVFAEEAPGTPAGGFLEGESTPSTGLAPVNITDTDYFRYINNQAATPFQFEDVPGNIMLDFTGQQFEDDTYFRFGSDADFNIGYNSSDDQMVVTDSSNQILFGIDKQGRLKMKAQVTIPEDTEIDTDLAKVGTEYYLRKDDTGDTYNMS